MAEEESRKLCGTSVTMDWLVETLKKSVPGADERAEVAEWSAEKIGVGQGFMSHIIRVSISWGQDDSIPSVVVLKVPTLETINKHIDTLVGGEESQMDAEEMAKLMAEVWLPMAHKAECALYEMFRDYSPLPIPRTWYGQEIGENQPGVLIMEDLSQTGALVDICDGLSLEQVFGVAEALACLHAYSIKHQGCWEDKFPFQDKELLKDYPTMIQGCAAQLSKMNPEYFEGKFEKIFHLFEVDTIYDTLFSHTELGLPAVLVQGDMWTNNLIFENRANDGKPGDRLLAIIDWQVTHPGNLAEDISRVLVSSTSAELRRNDGKKVFQHYFDKLREKMPEGQIPFTLEDVYSAYRRILPYSMAFYIFGLPLMANSPIVDGPNKEERIENLMIRGKCIVDDIVELYGK